jgi:hypothetical protein
MQHGGRLLGTGVYGCTFDPAPRCAGGSVFRSVGGMPAVGKITTEDTTEELSLGREIMALPLARQYFAAPVASCKPVMPLRDPDAGKCGITNGSEGDLTLLAMAGAGKDIMSWAADLQLLALHYERMFIHLLEGIVLLQSANIVHNDIHMGNILVDERGVARLIDFGLSFRLADIKGWSDSNLSTNFRPKYFMQAPEVHAWRMLLNGVRLGDGVAQLKSINTEYGDIERQYPARQSMIASLENLMRTSKAVMMRDGGAFVRAYGAKFDCWRIGLCMWLLWDDLLKWSGFQDTELWTHRDVIRRVLGGLTDFNPRTRFSAKKALGILSPNNRLAEYDQVAMRLAAAERANIRV